MIGIAAPIATKRIAGFASRLSDFTLPPMTRNLTRFVLSGSHSGMPPGFSESVIRCRIRESDARAA